MRGGNAEGAYYLIGIMQSNAPIKACIAKNTKRHDFPPNQNAIKDIYTHDLVKLIGAAKLQTALDARLGEKTSLLTTSGTWLRIGASIADTR